MIILKTKGNEASIDDLVSAVAREMEEEGAKLDEVKQAGRKKFAYPSNKIDGGHYVNYLFEADAPVIEKINERLKLNTDVHLQHYRRLA
ncbi:30S ribosomal protein S6 [Akkermansiaceae bacterium]|nr:30S ribosomal protein S6 [Akkermansiaceae bacterium]